MYDLMRALLKSLANGLAWLLAAPLAYPVRWCAPVDGSHAIFAMGSQMVSLIPGPPGVYIRRAYYRVVLGLTSVGFVVEFGAVLAQRGIHIGHNAYIGPYCNIGLSSIGDDVLLGSGVHLVSGPNVHFFDRTDVPIREQGGDMVPIRIGRDCWVGNQAVVMADVGEGAVIGAAALVNQPIEPYMVAVGNPAKPVRKRGEGKQG
jgi:acetyltransferase-like isoleucine patch superfamily enzyme